MIVEAIEAFYSEATGAVQPWRDIEVSDDVGNGLIDEGLVRAIGGGGGGVHFSDAAVTINISGDGTVVLSDIYFWAGGQLMYQDSMPLPKEASGETFYTLLVDGSAVVGCEPGEGVTSIDVTTSGDATYYNDEITINGDCTIIVELGGK